MNAASAGLPTFRHGVHPPEAKDATCGRATERMPFVPEYVLPLSQHLGAPSKPVVGVGQKVKRAQLLAEPVGLVSTALHAPVTGRVKAIELRLHPNGKMMESIVLETDAYASQRPSPAPAVDPFTLPLEKVVSHIQLGGLVGLGGAAFPTHVKLSVPKGKKANVVVLNGCECEPYLTCDHRIMLEHPKAIVRGLEIIRRAVGVEKSYIGIEANKLDAVDALRAAVGEAPIEVVPLQVKYPQGAEKMLLEAIFHKAVPTGGLPIDLGMMVYNVSTAVGVADLFDLGLPLIERVITVTGPALVEPKNLVVPLGTPLSAIVAHCGGLKPNARQVVLGGPMMGMAQKSLEVPLLKGASGILCLDRTVDEVDEFPCIRCGRCVEACPMFLNPARLALYTRFERTDDLEQHHLMSCFECASCSYVCPSNIPLVQWIRMGKGMVRNKAKKVRA